VLFGDEIHTLVGGIAADDAFNALMGVAFFLFLMELLVYSWTKSTIEFGKSSNLSNFVNKFCAFGDFTIHGYLFGFYFWLDFLAVVSMLPEVTWIAAALSLDFNASAAGDVGTAGKLGRVARMVRLVRLVKLYKTGAKRLEEKKKELELLELVQMGVITMAEFQERKENMDLGEKQSKVGAELSDTTTRRVIAIVLAMLCFVPLLSVSEANRAPHIMTAALQRYNYLDDKWNLLTAVVDVRTYFEMAEPQQESQSKAWRQPFLVYLEIYPYYSEFDDYSCYEATPSWENPSSTIDISKMASVCVRKENFVGGAGYTTSRHTRNVNNIEKASRAQLRSDEIIGEGGAQSYQGGVHYDANCASGPCYVRYKFNNKVELMDIALLSIITTMFVAFMLVVGAHTFTTDAERLVLTPIQEMMDLVQRVSDDPSRPIETKNDGGGQYETRKIENAIKKITDLLRIGFGVAGSEIVRENLSSKSKTSGGDTIDLMNNPGKRIYSVFGFCMIEEFDHMTDKMGHNIMDFINDVAKVVHENVNNWGGQCNKNLGGSFLMTWKVPDHFTKGSLNVDVSRIPYIARIADRALLGFVKVVADLNREEKILAYRQREELYIEHEDTGHLVPFKVCMGFGLHVGWGIEGPVGSLQKVDATYLSPHVNMAARCETAAKQWHVQILCTEVFHSCLSKAAQEHMRRLDKVQVKGSIVPMNMYTYDTFQDQPMVDKNAEIWKQWGDDSFDAYTKKKSDAYDFDTTKLWDEDPDLVLLRRHVSSPTESEHDIKKLHSKGVKAYLDGDWIGAKDILNIVDNAVGVNIKKFCHAPGVMELEHVNEGVIGDGPSKTLLAFMAKRQNKAPDGWDPAKGRALTSK
jgi:class 3 adenylate cyclase